MVKIDKWDDFFLRLAEVNASMSKDPSTKVGAVIRGEDNSVVSMGWNGFARGCDDDPTIYADRQRKLMRTIHAEQNAILTAGRSVAGCTLYVTPLCPCARCAAVIVQAGIVRVVAKAPDGVPERWVADYVEARRMFDEAGVSLEIER